jgi:hypothetical protein
MNRLLKCLIVLAVLIVAFAFLQPQPAEAGGGVAVYSFGYYNTGFYDPCYFYGYSPQFYSAYRSGYVQPVPYATYYNYRPFYDYVTPARAWVQPYPAAPGNWR